MTKETDENINDNLSDEEDVGSIIANPQPLDAIPEGNNVNVDDTIFLLENEEIAAIDNMERHAPDVENEEHTEEEFSSRSRCTAAGRGLDRLEMSFDGKKYTHGCQRQFLMVKED